MCIAQSFITGCGKGFIWRVPCRTPASELAEEFWCAINSSYGGRSASKRTATVVTCHLKVCTENTQPQNAPGGPGAAHPAAGCHSGRPPPARSARTRSPRPRARPTSSGPGWRSTASPTPPGRGTVVWERGDSLHMHFKHLRWHVTSVTNGPGKPGTGATGSGGSWVYWVRV